MASSALQYLMPKQKWQRFLRPEVPYWINPLRDLIGLTLISRLVEAFDFYDRGNLTGLTFVMA